MKILRVIVEGELLKSCGDCPLRDGFICIALKEDVGWDAIVGDKSPNCPLVLEHDLSRENRAAMLEAM